MFGEGREVRPLGIRHDLAPLRVGAILFQRRTGRQLAADIDPSVADVVLRADQRQWNAVTACLN